MTFTQSQVSQFDLIDAALDAIEENLAENNLTLTLHSHLSLWDSIYEMVSEVEVEAK